MPDSLPRSLACTWQFPFNLNYFTSLHYMERSRLQSLWPLRLSSQLSSISTLRGLDFTQAVDRCSVWRRAPGRSPSEFLRGIYLPQISWQHPYLYDFSNINHSCFKVMRASVFLLQSMMASWASSCWVFFFFLLVFTNHSRIQPNLLLGKREIEGAECFCFFWSQSLDRHSTLAASLSSCVPLGALLNGSVAVCFTCGGRKVELSSQCYCEH